MTLGQVVSGWKVVGLYLLATAINGGCLWNNIEHGSYWLAFANSLALAGLAGGSVVLYRRSK